MRPTKDEGAVVDLVDVLLEKGVILQADVVISVAEVPLIGVNLQAAIAGMATMTEHGFFEEWDDEIRDRDDDRRGVGRFGTPNTTAPATGNVARSVGRTVADHDGLLETTETPGAADDDDGPVEALQTDDANEGGDDGDGDDNSGDDGGDDADGDVDGDDSNGADGRDGADEADSEAP
ncbi:gas vesicle protein GvpM [Halorarum halophilum]|uniref:gas vesicle protein GvpM n=1 Tax=Halorarum halophilum TaxID=2743090 RepID=UPI001C4FFDF0